MSLDTKNQPGSVKSLSKREFWGLAYLTLLASKNFFSSHYNPKFIFASFVRIISFKQSKRYAHTTNRLHFTIQKVIKWRFLSLDTKNQASERVENMQNIPFWEMKKMFLHFKKISTDQIPLLWVSKTLLI